MKRTKTKSESVGIKKSQAKSAKISIYPLAGFSGVLLKPYVVMFYERTGIIVLNIYLRSASYLPGKALAQDFVTFFVVYVFQWIQYFRC